MIDNAQATPSSIHTTPKLKDDTTPKSTKSIKQAKVPTKPVYVSKHGKFKEEPASTEDPAADLNQEILTLKKRMKKDEETRKKW